MQPLNIGDTYNSLTLKNKELKEYIFNDGKVAEISTKTELTFACECGKEKKIWAFEVPGSFRDRRKILTDCGCGIDQKRAEMEAKNNVKKPVGRPPGRSKVQMSMGFDLEYIAVLNGYAKERNRSLTDIVNEAIVFYIASQ